MEVISTVEFMSRLLARALIVLVLAAILAGCRTGSNGAGDGSERGSSTGPTTGNGAVRWGQGDYGVVLAHGAAFDAASWEEQATAIAEQGATVIAVEDISTDGIRAAVDELRSGGIKDIALVGGSAGADAILELASREPSLPDQLILLSPNGPVDGLGSEPKLFIASEDESVANVAPELAESAPGDDNEAILLPGSAHAQNIFDTDQANRVLDAMLKRIERFSSD